MVHNYIRAQNALSLTSTQLVVFFIIAFFVIVNKLMFFDCGGFYAQV